MEQLSFETLISVLQEVIGPVLFWGLVCASLLVTPAYIFALIRDRSVSWRRFLWAQVSMPFGAVAAVLLVMLVTDSGIADLGGPIDIILVLLIAVAGAIGSAVLVYTTGALVFRKDVGPET